MPYSGKLNKILDYFRKPDEELVDKILKNLGIKITDSKYEELKTGILELIGRKNRQEKFSEYFTELSHELYEKQKMKFDDKNRTIETLKQRLNRDREKLKASIMMDAFSPDIFVIYDQPSLKLLNALQTEEKSYNSLKRELNLEDGDLKWRLRYFMNLGLIEADYSKDDESYSLSDTGKTILNKRGDDFVKIVNMLKVDDRYQLCLKACGGNRLYAKKFLTWLESDKGSKHLTIVEKMAKKFKNPKKVSQRFFCEREKGTPHEKHIGIKICDHKAAGELLLLQLEEYHEKLALKDV